MLGVKMRRFVGMLMGAALCGGLWPAAEATTRRPPVTGANF